MDEIELVKTFHGITIPIEIIDEENMYFTVSGIAKRYGKNITEWQNSKRMKETLRLLEKTNSQYPLILTKDRSGTQIHKKLFVNFARFISVEFELKADEIITEILLDGKHLCEKEREQYQYQIETAQKEIKILQHGRMKTYKGGFMSLGKYLKENNITMTKETAFAMLAKRDVVEHRDVWGSKLFLINDSFGIQFKDEVIKFNPRSLDLVFRDYIHTEPTLF